MHDDSIEKALSKRGVSRRDFLKFCTAMAATLALPSAFIPKIAEALEKKVKPAVLWLEFSDCAGDSESMLRATKPTIAEIVLDIISLEYHETIMAPSGKAAEKSIDKTVSSRLKKVPPVSLSAKEQSKDIPQFSFSVKENNRDIPTFMRRVKVNERFDEVQLEKSPDFSVEDDDRFDIPTFLRKQAD